ncbi:HAD family hydrolase [Patescibacteria group bacterium]|nr:HAD family hydrolase [Patescibacteria group bacterium]
MLPLLFYKPFFWNIKTIVWDYDGTLWQNNKLGNKLKKRYIQLLSKSLNKAITEKYFDKQTKKHQTWSNVIYKHTKIPQKIILNKAEKGFNKNKYIKNNQKLVNYIEKLTKFQHIILTNSRYQNTIKGLKKLGFKNNYPFKKIFARDNSPFIKPSPKAFQQILNYTKNPPKTHLMIGDSFYNDINPAHKLGFKTMHINKFKKLSKIN